MTTEFVDSPYGLILMYGLAAAMVWVSARTLSLRYPSDVRLVFYLFSLSSTATVLVVWWAIGSGAMDEHGGFHGLAGDAIETVYRTMTDFYAEMKILGALALLVIVPQFFGYVLSGLFGCAGAFVLLSLTTRFIFWSIVKFLVVASGIGHVLFVCGRGLGWGSNAGGTDFFGFLSAAVMLYAALGSLLVYRIYETMAQWNEANDAEKEPDQKQPGRLLKTLRYIHRFASRNSPAHQEHGIQITVTIPEELYERALAVADPGSDKADLVREAIETLVRVRATRLNATGEKALQDIPRQRAEY